MSDPNDLDADATLPPDPLGSTIPAPPPDFEVPVGYRRLGVSYYVDKSVPPEPPFLIDGHVNWDGFASPALDEELVVDVPAGSL